MLIYNQIIFVFDVIVLLAFLALLLLALKMWITIKIQVAFKHSITTRKYTISCIRDPLFLIAY